MNARTFGVGTATTPTETTAAAKPDFQIDADHAYRSSEATWRARVADSHPPALAAALGFQQAAERIATVATLPPPAAPLTVKVFDDTGGQVDEYEVPVDGYVIVTNGRCKVAASRQLVETGVHTLTLTGVAMDAAVTR